jgi:tricorn protease
VAPDVEMVHTPEDWAKQRQAQLAEAVRLALDLLKSKPPMQPPDYSHVPDRSRPPLPPRS